MRTILFYGNCQTRNIADVAAMDPTIAERFQVRYLPNHDNPLGPVKTPAPTEAELSACALFCEQGEAQKAFAYERLPADCAKVRFPPLDFNLLWPFHIVNPFHQKGDADPRWHHFPFGDRIIVRELERGSSVPQILKYYRERWSEYAVNVDRLLELERVRLTARDGRCDFGIATDVLENFRLRPLFFNFNHARRELTVAVAERLLERCGAALPDSRWDGVLQGIVEGRGESVLNQSEIPIHPKIAAAMKLEWYDPRAKYVQHSGERFTFDEYIEALANYCAAAKAQAVDEMLVAARREEVLPPVAGPAELTGRAFGLFQGRIGGSTIRFELKALERLKTVEVQGFCPEFHKAPISISMTVGGVKRERLHVQPGSIFDIACIVPVARDQCVDVELRSSGWFNLLAAGQGDDPRDLSVVLMELKVT